ncbi:expressed protein [Dictyostelium purpureum]|uniref:Expressed protein n=1 Tax=Dictyostelium purpureum TaxID=5786 RepID=F0ZIC2_DICPU|nr:uncharacterized protein DICPUDRAFT_91858 [Dictyostelium purpureum]EGC36299.1 expressed protein [Dictyostelium purpureum]|eukprot:XP_003287177.1 expressed protein [Dictyostelium purpureum]
MDNWEKDKEKIMNTAKNAKETVTSGIKNAKENIGSVASGINASKENISSNLKDAKSTLNDAKSNLGSNYQNMKSNLNSNINAQRAMQKSSGNGWLLGIAVLSIAGYFGWKQYQKKQDQKLLWNNKRQQKDVK